MKGGLNEEVPAPSMLPTHPKAALARWTEQQLRRRDEEVGAEGDLQQPPLASAADAPPLRRKRGRPKGSKNKGPPSPRPFPAFFQASSDDIRRARVAKLAVATAITRLEVEREELARAEEKVRAAQARVEAARKKVDLAEVCVRTTAAGKARDLLLEPTQWNCRYRQMLALRDEHGIDVSDLTIKKEKQVPEEKREEVRCLAKWMGCQRSARQKGDLEAYQEHLLSQELGVIWVAKKGPGPEKWERGFQKLVKFKEVHGHCRVPPMYANDTSRLGQWFKSQCGAYLNTMEGKKPVLTEERQKRMEELGVEWPARKHTTSWDQRFHELLKYKKDSGHTNVPFRWIGNRPLAQWVTAQRTKYMNLRAGENRRACISASQIQRLNAIGFEWSATGGRYNRTPRVDRGKIELLDEETHREQGCEPGIFGAAHAAGVMDVAHPEQDGMI